MKSIITLIVCLFLIIAYINPSMADSISYIAEYKFQSSEFDTPLSSRTMAIENTRRLLLVKMVTHFEAESEIKMLKLTNEKIYTLALLAFRPEIISEKNISGEYYIKAKMIADNRQFLKYFEAIQREPQKMKELEQWKKRADGLFMTAEKRKKELDGTPISNREQKIDPYMQVIKELDTMDDFIRGYSNALFGQHREAIVAFTRVIDLDQSNYFAFYNRGLSYLQIKDSNHAINDFENAINGVEVNIQSISNYKNIKSIIKEKDDPKKIIPIMDKAIRANPEDADAFYNRGTAYLVMKKFDNAISDFNRAIELKPKDLDYYYNRKVAIELIKASERWRVLPPSQAELQRRNQNERELATERAVEEIERQIAEQRQQEKMREQAIKQARDEARRARNEAQQARDESHHIPSSPPLNRGAINARTGEYYAPAAGGVINPRTGTFYQEVGGGYINSKTGAFMPSVGP